MNAGFNMWLLKPNDLNRGRGVHIFNNIEDLKKLINDYTNGVEIVPTKPIIEDDNEEQTKSPVATSLLKCDVFVIQKYIENPLLIKDRKFDIRLWVLISYDHKCYLFPEGYLRLSSYKYSLE
jgi:hypothetical protein